MKWETMTDAEKLALQRRIYEGGWMSAPKDERMIIQDHFDELINMTRKTPDIEFIDEEYAGKETWEDVLEHFIDVNDLQSVADEEFIAGVAEFFEVTPEEINEWIANRRTGCTGGCMPPGDALQGPVRVVKGCRHYGADNPRTSPDIEFIEEKDPNATQPIPVIDDPDELHISTCSIEIIKDDSEIGEEFELLLLTPEEEKDKRVRDAIMAHDQKKLEAKKQKELEANRLLSSRLNRLDDFLCWFVAVAFGVVISSSICALCNDWKGFAIVGVGSAIIGFVGGIIAEINNLYRKNKLQEPSTAADTATPVVVAIILGAILLTYALVYSLC